MTPAAVVVTGWAWRTPLGERVPAVFDRLCAGERAFTAAARHALDDYPVRWVAPLPGAPQPGRHGRFLRRMGQFALEVAAEALDQARPDAAGARLGLFFGYGGLRAHWQDMLPALAQQSPDGAGAWQRGFQLLHPFWMLQNLSNNAQAIAAQALGARGDGLTLGGANAGAQALAAAARALAAGAVDAAVVVGYDTLLEPESLIDLSGRGAYLGGAAQAPPAPYGEDAAGFVPGEAAAALVLERAAASRALARVAAADAADGARGEPHPATVAAVLARAFRDGGNVETPQLADGAARGHPALDRAERQALAAAGAAPGLPICATLAGMGQLGAAASLVQTIAVASALAAGRLPPVAGLRCPAPGPLAPATAAIAIADARSAIALSTGAPGLIGVVSVQLP